MHDTCVPALHSFILILSNQDKPQMLKIEFWDEGINIHRLGLHVFHRHRLPGICFIYTACQVPIAGLFWFGARIAQHHLHIKCHFFFLEFCFHLFARRYVDSPFSLLLGMVYENGVHPKSLSCKHGGRFHGVKDVHPKVFDQGT